MMPSIYCNFSDESEAADTGGLPSYASYEYQMLATVWIALELMVRGPAGANSVELAPKEDVLAHIDHPSDKERERAGSQVTGGDVQIQIKLRNHRVLTSAGFRVLLERKEPKSKGQMPRGRAVDYLTKKNHLVTAFDQCSGGAGSWRCVVKNIVDLTTASEPPAGIAASYHHLAPRIASYRKGTLIISIC